MTCLKVRPSISSCLTHVLVPKICLLEAGLMKSAECRKKDRQGRMGGRGSSRMGCLVREVEACFWPCACLLVMACTCVCALSTTAAQVTQSAINFSNHHPTASCKCRHVRMAVWSSGCGPRQWTCSHLTSTAPMCCSLRRHQGQWHHSGSGMLLPGRHLPLIILHDCI